MNMLTIDGSFGEGGGQILRSSLALSILTETPVEIHSIRAKRKSPGLKNQHRTSVRAAAEICGGELTGDYLGSSKIRFVPGKTVPGTYSFDTGTAGSCFLVFQTIYPALISADQPSKITIRGGTHNLMAPPAEFVERSFLKTLQSVGLESSFTLNRYGWYPAGGGEVEISVVPGRARCLDLSQVSPVRKVTGEIITIKKPGDVSRSQAEEFRAHFPEMEIEMKTPYAVGPGNSVAVTVVRDEIAQVFTGFGKRETPAHITARAAAVKAKEHISLGAAADFHLTDQLMIPLLLGEGGRFTCPKPTMHSVTNAEIIRIFTGKEIRFEQISGALWICEVPGIR